jgi:2-dehydropantoate 2-reductase
MHGFIGTDGLIMTGIGPRYLGRGRPCDMMKKRRLIGGIRNMNIVIIGAGAVGGYFGARFAEAVVPITFLVREQRQVQLRTRGLRVHSPYGNLNVQPATVSDPIQIETPNLVIVALKNYHLQAALPSLITLASKGAYILPLLNGIEHLSILKKNIPEAQILGGTCYIESTLNADGDIMHTSDIHDFVFGTLSPEQTEFSAALTDALKPVGFNWRQSENILLDMWQKYIFLSTFSGMTAAVRQPIGAILKDPVTFKFYQELLEEVVAIAHGENADVSLSTATHVMARAEKFLPTMTSSLHRDLEKGMPIELESLQGALLRMAEAQKLPAPHLQAVYSLLHPYTTGAPSQSS